MTADALREARSEHRQAFWTLVVGAPAALSVLRLWVESGGELQTTLLLVSNVGPLNLGAALFATITQLVTVVLIAIFAIGGVLRASGQRSLVTRAATAVSPWFVVGAYALAVLTWDILYLPLLLPAAVATAQRAPWRLAKRWPVALVVCLLGIGAYYWLVGPALWSAWTGGERLVAVLLALPPLVAFGVAGPLPTWFARLFAVVAQLAILGLAVLALVAALRTPILPLVVVSYATPTGAEFVRGNIVSVDDAYLTLLQEHGGVRYLPTGEVGATVLCGTTEELPAYATRIRDYHVEDSLLRAFGRHVRPRVQVDPLCRISEPASN